MSWLFASGGQSIEALASALVFPMNIQDRFALGLTGLISLLSKGLSRVFSSTKVWKHQFLGTQPSYCLTLSHLYMTTGKTIALSIRTFVGIPLGNSHLSLWLWTERWQPWKPVKLNSLSTTQVVLLWIPLLCVPMLFHTKFFSVAQSTFTNWSQCNWFICESEGEIARQSV